MATTGTINRSNNRIHALTRAEFVRNEVWLKLREAGKDKTGIKGLTTLHSL